MRKVDKKNCSDCKVGLLDKYTNVGGCPYYTPTKDTHCALWKPLNKNIENVSVREDVTDK